MMDSVTRHSNDPCVASIDNANGFPQRSCNINVTIELAVSTPNIGHTRHTRTGNLAPWHQAELRIYRLLVHACGKLC